MTQSAASVPPAPLSSMPGAPSTAPGADSLAPRQDGLKATMRRIIALGKSGDADAAYREYASTNIPVEPPFFARTVHPAPPTEITVHDAKIDMLGSDNPLRHLEKSDPEAFKKHVANGKSIYYEHCFFCHADALGGDGMYAHGLNPAPANFIDQRVLPNFQETFFFWRIAKGGPGMPDEGGPGDSAMPEWERFLSNEQMWEVVLFLYDHTGYRPRAREVHAEGH